MQSPSCGVSDRQPKIADDLVPPAFGGAEGFQQFGLVHEIRLLIVAGHAGIADRRHVFVAEAEDFAHVVITDAALAAPIRDQLAGCLPRAQGLDLNAQDLRRFPIFTSAIALEINRYHELLASRNLPWRIRSWTPRVDCS